MTSSASEIVIGCQTLGQHQLRQHDPADGDANIHHNGLKSSDNRRTSENGHMSVVDLCETFSVAAPDVSPDNTQAMPSDDEGNDSSQTLDFEHDGDQASFDVSSNFDFSSTIEGWTGFEAPRKDLPLAQGDEQSDRDQVARIIAIARNLAEAQVPKSAWADRSRKSQRLFQEFAKRLIEAAESLIEVVEVADQNDPAKEKQSV